MSDSNQQRAAILLIEPHTGLREVLLRVLSDAGFEAKSAASLGAAEAEFTGHPDGFLLVVLDAFVSSVAELDAMVARIREIDRHVPILCTVASSKIEGSMGAGVFILRRPFTVVEFRANINRVLEARATAR